MPKPKYLEAIGLLDDNNEESATKTTQNQSDEIAALEKRRSEIISEENALMDEYNDLVEKSRELEAKANKIRENISRLAEERGAIKHKIDALKKAASKPANKTITPPPSGDRIVYNPGPGYTGPAYAYEITLSDGTKELHLDKDIAEYYSAKTPLKVPVWVENGRIVRSLPWKEFNTYENSSQ